MFTPDFAEVEALVRRKLTPGQMAEVITGGSVPHRPVYERRRRDSQNLMNSGDGIILDRDDGGAVAVKTAALATSGVAPVPCDPPHAKQVKAAKEPATGAFLQWACDPPVLRGAQACFVDGAAGVVTEADQLLGDVMSARGYPVSDVG